MYAANVSFYKQPLTVLGLTSTSSTVFQSPLPREYTGRSWLHQQDGWVGHDRTYYSTTRLTIDSPSGPLVPSPTRTYLRNDGLTIEQHLRPPRKIPHRHPRIPQSRLHDPKTAPSQPNPRHPRHRHDPAARETRRDMSRARPRCSRRGGDEVPRG